MDINKTCLDCKFALWHGGDESYGMCSWMFPMPLPKWLAGVDILEVHNYNVKRKIYKDRPHVNCPAWKEIEKS